MKTTEPRPTFATEIVTPIFRLSYPHIFAPNFNALANSGKGRNQYDIVMMFDKRDKEALKPMYDLMKHVAEFYFGIGVKGIVNPFKDGDLHKNKAGELLKDKNPMYTGHMILNSWTVGKPGIVSIDIDPKTQKYRVIEDPDEVYGGCYCRAKLNCYKYNTAGNKGISFGLIHVQKMKDGDPFGNRSRAEDAFAPVANSDSQAEDTQDDGGMFS